MRTSESLPAAYGFAAGAAAPKENGLRWESRGSPIYSAGLGSRAASHTPATRRVRLTVSSSSVLAFTPVSRVRHTLEVSRLQSSLIPKSTGIVTARELASPPFEDVYIRACPTRSPSISVEYDYVDKQSIPTAGLSPASPTALWAAGHRITPTPDYPERSLCSRKAHAPAIVSSASISVLIGLNILAFFLNIADICGPSGRSLDERQQSFLSINHESVKIIGTQKRRVNQMRCEIAIEPVAINRWCCRIASF